MTTVRNVQSSDYSRVKAVMNDWWDGRDLSGLLPKLFFVHFQDTSFIVEDNGRLIAFLIGFLSQSNPGEAYIHFVGVHPDYRNKGVAKQLYEQFFDQVKIKGRHVVRAITSPINEKSVLFHQRMGFEIVDGNKEVNGIQVTENYGGPGIDRVLFLKRLP
ncbi:MAG TPA: GNAT family N-acetyltransferase [Bacillales bacterium]|nr:GNAT family N-acetyltransferase [Bacillales bacterium]